MTSFISNGIVKLTIDGIMSFLQLLDVQNMRFSLKKGCRKFSQSVQDSGIAIDYEGFRFFKLCCVLESK